MTDSLGYISVIGVSLIEPILELVEKLESTTPVAPREVNTSPHENGFSCAIAVLSVLLLESALNRTGYIRKDTNNRDLAAYFGSVTGNKDLEKDIDEAIAVRDAVVHNHLWETNVYWDDTGLLKFRSPPKRLEGYGDKRLRRVMDPKTIQSRRLKLNLFPTRIWRHDAYNVFKVVGRALEALEAIDRNYFYVSQHDFQFRDQLLALSDILKALPY